MVFGGALFLLGLVLAGLSRLHPGGWRLPGDVVWRRPGFTLILPLGTSLALSAVLSLVFWVLSLLGRR
jgi:hypothetical protein